MGRVFGKGPARKWFGMVLLLVILVPVGYLAFTGYQLKKMTREWYHQLPESHAWPQSDPEANLPPAPDAKSPNLLSKPAPLKPFTLLLIGIDSREGERARSDTMMLAALHPAKQRGYLLSIPRDSYVNLPDRGYDKLNHAMAFGGPALVKQSLEPFFHVRIDRYMTIDFEGFRKIVDELGGVKVHVKKRMKYSDPTDGTNIDLMPGEQVLNGKQALDYVRFRKSDLGPDDNDYDRIKRQQEILQALANKGDSVQTFLKVFKLMDILGSHVKTDLTEAEISSLLFTYYDAKDNHLETDMLRGQDQRIWHHGIRGWYYLVPKDERLRVRQRFQSVLSGQAGASGGE